MEPLDMGNDALDISNADPRLRTELLDELMAARGATTFEEHSRRFDIDRVYYYRIRNGKRSPSVRVAMNMAAAAGTTVEQIFERAA